MKHGGKRIIKSPVVGKSDEHPALYRKARVRGSPGETPPCTLMSPGACKIRRGCNVLQVPIQIIPLVKLMDVLLNGHSISAEGELQSLCCMMGKTMSPNVTF